MMLFISSVLFIFLGSYNGPYTVHGSCEVDHTIKLFLIFYKFPGNEATFLFLFVKYWFYFFFKSIVADNYFFLAV